MMEEENGNVNAAEQHMDGEEGNGAEDAAGAPREEPEENRGAEEGEYREQGIQNPEEPREGCRAEDGEENSGEEEDDVDVEELFKRRIVELLNDMAQIPLKKYLRL